MLTIQFETSNAAFDGTYTEEVIRILHEITKEIERNGPAHAKQKIRDINGNTVGFWHDDAGA